MSNSLERKINIHFSNGSHIESKQLSNKLRGYNSNFLWEQMQESITKELKWWGVTLTGNQKTVKALSELMTINKTLFENLYKVQSDTIEESELMTINKTLFENLYKVQSDTIEE
ncbi:hypothetical protein, partial [Bacillus velezensis]|uniref:hypothetical protein n=1 Tax=Bacillus velezensis TaxID=492670 RepID=UPI001156836D